jgi:hypothetical protein
MWMVVGAVGLVFLGASALMRARQRGLIEKCE